MLRTLLLSIEIFHRIEKASADHHSVKLERMDCWISYALLQFRNRLLIQAHSPRHSFLSQTFIRAYSGAPAASAAFDGPADETFHVSRKAYP